MPEWVDPHTGQLLPTEVILIIFEHALDHHPWQLLTLSLVSKQLRALLHRRLFQQVHCRSVDQMDQVIVKGWPPHSTPSTALAEQHLPPLKLALYLNFVIDFWKKEAEFYEELETTIDYIPEKIRSQIDTLGIRALPGDKNDRNMCLWMTPMMPQLRRLYIDTSVMDYSNLLAGHALMTKLTAQCCPDCCSGPQGINNHHTSDHPLFKEATSLEAFAFGVMSFRDFLGHLDCRRARRYWLRKVFPNLKRLYLFALDGKERKLDEDLLATDFDEMTSVECIVYVATEEMPLVQVSSCAREANVIAYPRGTMVFKTIIVDQPKDQLLNLMHRVIDDFEAEWAPEAFGGRRWSPTTRPRYTKAIPSKVIFEKSGRQVPLRLPPCPVDP